MTALQTLLGTPELAGRFNFASLAYYPRLAAVARYVEAHLHEPITLAEVAAVACLERKYFSAFFRAKVGTGFSEWLRLLRSACAARMLRERNESITAVAFAVGFADLRTFERSFKRLFGCTPLAYRSDHRPESRWMPIPVHRLPPS